MENLQLAIPEMQEAILAEIRAAAGNKSQKIDLDQGTLLSSGDGFIYSFRSEVRSHFPPESPIKFHYHHEVIKGIWIGQDDFEVILQLSERVDGNPIKGSVTVDFEYILRMLSDRLSELTEEKPNATIEALFGSKKFDASNLRAVDRSIQKLKDEGQSINVEQEKALRRCSSSRIHFVWGPPGTGKTANLSHASRIVCEAGEKLLVVAHANKAVDVAMLRIADSMKYYEPLRKGKIIRIGFSSNKAIREHPYISVFGILRREEPELIRQMDELELHSKHLQEQLRKQPRYRDSINDELKEVRAQLEKIRARLREREAELISQSEVIGCTAAKAVIDERVWKRKSDAIIIDEVSMMNFPYVAAFAGRAENRLLMFGDFQQLAPIAVSQTKIAAKWFGEDAFRICGVDKSIRKEADDDRITMLKEQFRMQSKICHVVNALSYDGKLTTHHSVDRNLSSIGKLYPGEGESLVLLDTSNLKSSCLSPMGRMQGSRRNLIQALLDVNLAVNLSSQNDGVCVITPYRAQANLVDLIATGLNFKLSVETVHKFQGSEQNIVIFDLCDAIPEQRASKLTGHDQEAALRLINVAISRAKGKLIVIADRQFVDEFHYGNSPSKKLLKYIEQQGRCLRADFDQFADQDEIFEWFDDFSSAQMALVRELKDSKSVKINIPATFIPSTQLVTAIENASQKMERAFAPVEMINRFSKAGESFTAAVSPGGFYAIFDRCVIVGGREADAPLVLVNADLKSVVEPFFLDFDHGDANSRKYKK